MAYPYKLLFEKIEYIIIRKISENVNVLFETKIDIHNVDYISDLLPIVFLRKGHAL